MPTSFLQTLTLIAALTPQDVADADLDRFPCASVTTAGLRAARERVDWLQYHRPVLDGDWCAWHEELEYARWRFNCFDWLHAAYGLQGPNYPRLYSLRRVRELLGEEAWFAGWMP